MSSVPEFSVLFGESSHGKRKMWKVSVEDRDSVGVVIVTHGYEGGKMVVNEREITVGKNLGKKNATTPVMQAVSEAQALWNKKKDAAYAPATAESAAGGAGVSDSDDSNTSVVVGVPLPMLAKDFVKNSKHIKFPCFAQRKLDGVRCVAIPGKGLFSRNGKATSAHLTHISAEVNSIKTEGGVILDGELYSDDLTFQEIVGLVKKGTLKKGDAEKIAKIHLCVYDCIDDKDAAYTDRKTLLTDLFAKKSFKHLRLLPTVVCADIGEVKKLHADYVAEGYEGLILRNTDGKYKIKHRSNDLQKYKEFFDSEYPIIGYKEGDGIEKGCVIWICKTPKDQEFAVRPRGTHEDRAAAFLTGKDALGKMLTVRYQELTTDGIPRFPVGLAIRDYE